MPTSAYYMCDVLSCLTQQQLILQSTVNGRKEGCSCYDDKVRCVVMYCSYYSYAVFLFFPSFSIFFVCKGKICKYLYVCIILFPTFLMTGHIDNDSHTDNTI